MNAMVHEVLAETVSRYGDRAALSIRQARDGTWQTLSWREYQRGARLLGRGLIALGAEPGKGVAIIGQNCPQWLIADVGTMLAGGVATGIYPTSTPGQVSYITDHCEAKVAFADTAEQVERFLVESERLPRLEVIVQMRGMPKRPPAQEHLQVISWKELLDLGMLVSEDALDERIRAQRPNDTCTLIYTSGTTGQPKAVMVTHANIVASGAASVEALGLSVDDVILSYLPLNHLAEQMLSIHMPIRSGTHVYFTHAFPNLGSALQAVRPTVFAGVPRVWEKMRAAVLNDEATATALKRSVMTWGRRIGLEAAHAKKEGQKPPLGFRTANTLVLAPIRRRLGLDRARVCETGAAPTSLEAFDFFDSIGLPLIEVYGMSESGPSTYVPPDAVATGSCGVAIPGTELRIADDGEICMRGPTVCKGYFKDPEATKAAIDADGWLHSGDLGTLDEQGYLRITGRKKDLLITAGGENVAPRPIEEMLEAIVGISQAVVVGDRKKYLAALLTLEPGRIHLLAQKLGSSAKTPLEAARCPRFRAYLQNEIDVINSHLARVQTVKRFVVLPKELTVEDGELTPTLKIRRNVIVDKYAGEIASMYPEAPSPVSERSAGV